MKIKIITIIALALLVICICCVFTACGDKESKQLYASENLSIVDEILTWNTVKNASSYIVSINDSEYEVEANQLDLFEITNEFKTYKNKWHAYKHFR